MNKREMEDQIFEIMLKAAVEENFDREIRELPEQEALPDDCELSLHTRRKIEKMMKDANRHSMLLRIRTLAKKAAVIAAIVIPISLVSLLSVEASRNAIFNALLDWKSDHIDIQYQDKGASSEQQSSSAHSVMKPQYLPKGFFEVQTTKIGLKNETEYRNEQGSKILLVQTPLSEEGSVAVDTEHSVQKEIEIQGEKAILFVANEPEDTSYLVWKNYSYHFLLISKISSEELVKIAESMMK